MPNPQSLPNTLPAVPVTQSPPQHFAFTYRRAEDKEWGILFDGGSSNALQVRDVTQGGAIDCWNKLATSTGGPIAVKAVWPGDFIVEVNGKRDRGSMVEEFSRSVQLKIQVLRQKSDP